MQDVIHLLLAIALLFSVSAGTLSAADDNAQFIEFSGDRLQAGRQVWLDNCKTCHAYGIASAPIPMQPQQWQHRVVKPRSLLYDHAINGFFGPDDAMMPARGGNDALTDEQVKRAVDYMVMLASFYIDQQSN